MERKMKPIDNNKEPYFNIVKFDNDPELWETRKRIIYDVTKKDLRETVNMISFT